MWCPATDSQGFQHAAPIRVGVRVRARAGVRVRDRVTKNSSAYKVICAPKERPNTPRHPSKMQPNWTWETFAWFARQSVGRYIPSFLSFEKDERRALSNGGGREGG